MEGDTITILTPALPALDLPPPAEHETEEEMAIRGQKHLRSMDDSDSGDEVQHKSVRDITGDRVSTTSASPPADLLDLPDTTIAIHLDPDTEPLGEAASSAVVEGTTSVPPEVDVSTGDRTPPPCP